MLPEPYYTSPQTDDQGRPRAVLYCGDCLSIAPLLDGVGAVVSDPPYGMGWTANITVGPNSKSGHSPGARSSLHGATVTGDDEPFDPSPWLGFPHVVLWGSNHYAARLPLGTTLIWVKRYDGAFGSFLSDAEVAWMSGGHGVYCYRHVYCGPERLKDSGSDRGAHPTMKPVGLMEWCITERAKVPTSDLILDPYMGSGTTGVACAKTGHRFVGIEIEERYCEIAAKRIDAALSQPSLFPVTP